MTVFLIVAIVLLVANVLAILWEPDFSFVLTATIPLALFALFCFNFYGDIDEQKILMERAGYVDVVSYRDGKEWRFTTSDGKERCTVENVIFTDSGKVVFDEEPYCRDLGDK